MKLAALLFVLSAFGQGYIIKFKKKIPSLIQKKGALASLNMIHTQSIPKNLAMEDVEYIEEDTPVELYATPRNGDYPRQWALKKIQAEAAWDIHKGSKKVIVAIVDSGIQYNHPGLEKNIWINEAEKNGQPGIDDDKNGYVDDIHGYDFFNEDSDPMDDRFHGTHCAGIVGAIEENHTTPVGINWKVRLMAVKFSNHQGKAYFSSAIKGIIYAVDNGAKVINASWGGKKPSKALREAVSYAHKKNVLFVAASGNSRTTEKRYPAAYQLDNIISVAASGPDDAPWFFTNKGLHVHLAAPGEDILSTDINSDSGFSSGTSMAAPFVAGAAALLLAQEDLTPQQVRQRILRSVDVLPQWKGLVSSGGRLNVYRLLKK